MSNATLTNNATPLPDLRPAVPASLAAKLAVFAGDIKISHTIFALPFALLSTFLAAHQLPGRLPHIGQMLLILICMFTARTIAMAVNRLLDARIDAGNARTARRAIPAGVLTRTFYVSVVVLCAIGFFASCAGFYACYANPWPIICSAPVLAFLSAYPLLKRFTRLCHYYLGAALALAPICAWVAISGSLAPPPFWMAGAVLCWTAGFDIIYACLDYDADVAHGVFSVPAKVGIGAALWISRATHLSCACLLIALGYSASPPLGTLYFIGVGIAITLLAVEHVLVKANDLSKVGIAFFTINGIISVVLGTLGIIDVLR